MKIIKTTSGSYPRADLSNVIIFSPSQSHATVPLNTFLSLYLSKMLMYNVKKKTLPSNFFLVKIKCYVFSGLDSGSEK
jgi:hypothetical protein